jgi:hypothetical protein
VSNRRGLRSKFALAACCVDRCNAEHVSNHHVLSDSCSATLILQSSACVAPNREAARPTAVLQLCAPAVVSTAAPPTAHGTKTDSQLTNENSCSDEAANSSCAASIVDAAVASCAPSYACYIFHLAHMGEERVLPPSLAKLLCDPTVLKVKISSRTVKTAMSHSQNAGIMLVTRLHVLLFVQCFESLQALIRRF